MSLQKIGASLIAQSNEANLGLATLNLDFSIIKVEAPAEFKALQNELSVARQNAAEDGMPHVTARKIGALFHDWIPRTPHLIKAYGKRSVEIAQCRTVNPKPTKADGAFAEHVGIDGTGIWAAATSGAHAIAVYLLACMLARMWSPSEATAIWDELVQERKKELAAINDTDSLYEQSRHTSRISIPREDLAQWDASARAWLRAADEAMSKKQKQLMLILNNVELPVSTSPGLLKSVQQVWVSAMTTVDLLVQGVAQSIEDGSVLLGLSSWHIYPDMLILGSLPQQTQVDQNDTLVHPGGILTIGLHIQSPLYHGVYWSLSLSHLRYYGGPVVVEGSLDTQGNHVTIYELWQVAVGSLTKRWAMDNQDMASLLVKLYDYIAPNANAFSDGNVQYWLYYIARAVEPLRSADSTARTSCIQFMKYGERRCAHFLGRKMQIPTLFGVMDLSEVLELVTDEAGAGVDILRSYVQSIKSNVDRGYIIQYAVGHGDEASYVFQFEYATALPTERQTLKRTLDGDVSMSKRHIRWVSTIKAGKEDDAYDDSRLKRFQGEDTFPIESQEFRWSKNVLRWRNAPDPFSSYATAEGDSIYGMPDEEDVDMSLFLTGTDDENSKKNVDFFFVAGDPARIALYATKFPNEDIESSTITPWDPKTRCITPEILDTALNRRLLDSTKLIKYMNTFVDNKSRRNFLTSLRALATVDKIYNMLPGALAAIEVTSSPLCDTAWIPPSLPKERQLLQFRFSAIPADIGTTFSCIAFFHSGSLAIDPKGLNNVIAMATGDSIYISASLLCDPSELCLPYEVRRVRGGLGKPGIAMLIPPKELRVRSIADSDWRQVNHHIFDGKVEDSFQSTSLHLWFTDYVLPIDTGVHGLRSHEAYFLESVVSLHDRGHWIADIDILKQRRSSRVGRLCKKCDHDTSKGASKALIGSPRLTMIDNWHEMLDPAGNAAIVRSTGNWLGRLAATCISLQLGHPTIVMPNNFCWDCVVSEWQKMQLRTEQESRKRSTSRLEHVLDEDDAEEYITVMAQDANQFYQEVLPEIRSITGKDLDGCLEIMSKLVLIC